MSPLIAEIHPPVPIAVHVAICLTNTIATLFLRKHPGANQAMKEIDDRISHTSKITGSKKNGKESFQNIRAPAGDDQDDYFQMQPQFDAPELVEKPTKNWRKSKLFHNSFSAGKRETENDDDYFIAEPKDLRRSMGH